MTNNSIESVPIVGKTYTDGVYQMKVVDVKFIGCEQSVHFMRNGDDAWVSLREWIAAAFEEVA